VSGAVEDSELFRADYMDSTFDRIDKELKKEKKPLKFSQSSRKDGPPQGNSQMR
jgi:hypothetical protein